METKIVHMCLDVRGALKTMTRRELASMFKHDDGRKMTADEARDALMDELSKGHEVIPFSKACEGFDYSGGGCPGHAVTANGQGKPPPKAVGLTAELAPAME